MDWYRVIKKIDGHRYYYWQKTHRAGKQVKTLNKYIGPVDKVPRPAARLASSGVPSINGGMKSKKGANVKKGYEIPEEFRSKLAAVGLATLSGFDQDLWYAYAQEKGINLDAYLNHAKSLEYPRRDVFINKLVDIIIGYNNESFPPLPSEHTDPVEIEIERKERMVDLQLTEIERKGADAYNIGWYQDDKSIATKTSKGIITTIISSNGEISHTWHNEE